MNILFILYLSIFSNVSFALFRGEDSSKENINTNTLYDIDDWNDTPLIVTPHRVDEWLDDTPLIVTPHRVDEWLDDTPLIVTPHRVDEWLDDTPLIVTSNDL